MVDYTANGTLYDSESSLDEPLFISLPKEREDKTDTNSQPISCSQESEASYSASQSVNLQTESTSAEEIVHPEPISELQPQEVNQQRNCENKILSNMAKFYDCCSSNEAFLKSCGYVDLSDALPKYSTATSRSTLTAGLWDELPIEDAKTQRLHLLKENMFDVIANLELRTYVKCLEDISRASEEVISGHEHSISIAPQQQCFGLVNLQSCDPRYVHLTFSHTSICNTNFVAEKYVVFYSLISKSIENSHYFLVVSLQFRRSGLCEVILSLPLLSGSLRLAVVVVPVRIPSMGQIDPIGKLIE